MKKLFVRSKSDAKNFTSDEPWIAIQVSTREGEWPPLRQENLQGTLLLAFQDSEFPGRATISFLQAQSIFKFIEQHKDVENILVHCEFGHSRSPAIAAAIANVYNAGEDRDWFQPPYTPNRLVYKAVLEAADHV